MLVIDHDIVRLDIAMHDAVAVTVVERLEQLVEVVAKIGIGQRRIENLFK